jgi:hypothetical protein
LTSKEKYDMITYQFEFLCAKKKFYKGRMAEGKTANWRVVVAVVVFSFLAI